ncbi:hypothetical protein ACR3EC_06015, partial [Corynebacterium diphtheriae]
MPRWINTRSPEQLDTDARALGGFNWLSQHPEHGGVRRWLPRTGVRRPVICRWGCGVSGVRIG